MNTKKANFLNSSLIIGLTACLALGVLIAFTNPKEESTSSLRDQWLIPFGNDKPIQNNSISIAYDEMLEAEPQLNGFNLRIEAFEIYNEFDLLYDSTSDELYFNGELVRYFEDRIDINDVNENNETIEAMIVTHFTETGVIDVYVEREHYSQMLYNPDGTRNLSSTLLGVTAFSQAEFEARDFAKLMNKYQSTSLNFDMILSDSK